MSKYVRRKDIEKIYPFCAVTIQKHAEKAGAIVRVGRTVLIDTEKFDAYLEELRKEGDVK